MSLFAAGAILHGELQLFSTVQSWWKDHRRMTMGLAGGTDTAGTVRAASPGWPNRSPGSALNQDSSQPGTVQSMGWAQAALLRAEWLGLGVEGAAPPPEGSAGGQQQLCWVTLISLCVSIRAWRTHGSRTSLSPMVPRPVHWPVTLDFLWHCQHEPCFQKKPNQVKEAPCS